MTPLNKLNESINGHMAVDMSGEETTQQLQNWQGLSSIYLQEAENAEKALNEIDENLRNKLLPNIESIKQAAQYFWNSVNDPDVVNSVEELNNNFTEIMNTLNMEIKTQIEEVRITLNEHFDKIDRQIHNLTQTKNSHINFIIKAVEAAKTLAETSVGVERGNSFENYKRDIGQKFGEVKSAVEKFTASGAPLLSEFGKIKHNVEGLEDKVRDGLTKLKENIEDLTQTMNDGNTLVVQAMATLQAEKKVLDAAYAKVSAQSNLLKSTYDTTPNFKSKFDDLNRQVNELSTGNVEMQLNQLAVRVEKQLNTLSEINTKVQGEVDKEFDSLKEQTLKTHVETLYSEIKQNVWEYVQKFGEALQAGIKEAKWSHAWGSGIYEAPGLKALGGHLKSHFQKFVEQLNKLSTNGKGELAKCLEDAIVAFGKAKDNFSDPSLVEIVEELKSGLHSKIDGSRNKLNPLLKNAAQHGTSIFAKNLNEKINGTLGGSGGIKGDIQKEMDKLKLPDLDTDTFQLEFSRFKKSIQAVQQASKIAKSTETLVQRQVDEVMQVVTGLEDSVSSFDTKAKISIMNAAQKAIDDVVTIFKVNSEQHIDVKNLMEEFEKSRNELAGAALLLGMQLEKLKKLPATVSTRGEEAGKIMERLKDEITKIKTAIEHITPIVDKAGKAFDTIIANLNTALRDARTFAGMAFPALQSSFQKHVTNAFNDMEECVQMMFSKQKKADFEFLRLCVANQIPDVKTVIDKDMRTGPKGLMRKSERFASLLRNSGNILDAYASRVHNFFINLFNELTQQPDLSPHQSLLTPLAGALSSLLSTMHSRNHFDATVSRKLADLQAALDTLTPAKFAEASPLLNVVKAGVTAFHGELAKQYVSRYAGVEVGEMVVNDKITTYGTKLSKVFLTSLSTLCDDLNPLKKYSGSTWRQDRINKDSSVGYFLARRGYEVNVEKDKQTGELQDKPGMLGFHIFKSLDKSRGSDNEHLQKCKEEENESDEKARTAATKSQFGVVGILNCLFRHLHQYYTACHFRRIERPKSPSNIYQMLVWLTGLPHNRVNSTVSVSDIAQLFEKPDVEAGDSNNENPPILDKDPDTLEAYPQTIAASELSTTLRDVCVYAEDVLIGILGHGHADGIYAVDFNTNPDGFSYPTAPGACFDMLCDVLNRLYQQLYFVYKQCSNDESCAGWLNCWYGQGVGGSSFNCNTKQCANQICDQKANQKRDQIHEQMGDQHPNCGLKSPLQSFLEDGLPGFLPHQFDKPGCKLTCTYSNHRGLPCKTPMGFTDISSMASHTQNGAYLKKVLKEFCGDESAPLTQLCAQLTCLLQKPPQTLGDIFAFYYSYLKDWAGDYYGIRTDKQHTQQAFEEAVNAAYFGTQYGGLDPSELCSSKSHKDDHTKGDLCSVTTCTTGADKPCGLYVTSIAQQITTYYASDQKGNHLSWIVYITETLYDLLKKLYDECCAKCDKRGTRCHDKRCVETCQVKYSDDEKERAKLKLQSHNSDCKSIITCRNTHPTLYKYGFTFGNPWALNGLGKDAAAKRTCKDFCEALKLMLVEESVLIKLRKQIDQFLWDIREKFSFTVLALWLLSLLYLIHILVIRLDLLHIKSHLHSPSSHRIAAQSLLAAARVNKLNKVFYLQP